MTKLVSIIIPTLNCESTIDECLKSIFDNKEAPQFEVIMVDGGSSDNTIEIARKYPVQVYSSGKPQARQRNLGIEKAAGEIIAFTDGDVRVNPDWLSILYRHFENNDIASVGGPNLTPPDDPFWAQCFGALLESSLGSAGTRNTAVYQKCREVKHNPPVNSAVRKQVLNEVGGFQDDFAVSEDVMLDEKIRSKGYRLIYDPQMIVWHHRRPSLKSFIRQMLGYGRGRASAFLKYPNSLPITYFCALLLVLGIILTAPIYVLIPLLRPVIIGGWILYFLFVILSSVYIALRRKQLIYMVILPVITIIEHITIGIGFIQGFFRPYK